MLPLRFRGSEQRHHGLPKRVRNLFNVVDRDIALCTFDGADVVGVKTREPCKLFLGKPLALAQALHVRCEKLSR